MTDPKVYLEKLTVFSKILRAEGVHVTPAQTEDAARILTVLGFEDRQQVKTALRTVYAKSREEQLIFDQSFDGFFVTEQILRENAMQEAIRQSRIEQNRVEAQQLEELGLSDEQQYTYAVMPEQERQKLRDFIEKYRDHNKRNPDLYTGFIHSVFTKTLLEQQIKMEDAAVGCQAKDPELGMLYRDITQFQDNEIPKAISIIQTISRQINGELTAKRKKSGRTAKLDFRRTIRKGLETGGSFYRLKYKKKRNRRKTLVILCDVSGSMVQFSEFALRFIQSLNQASEGSRVFLFSEDLFEADAFSLQNMDLFRAYVRDSGIYGKGTDLGKAVKGLLRRQPGVLSSATTLLILSDTKTVDQVGAAEAVALAKRKAGKVLWLNPIPQSQWAHLKGPQLFGAVCPMICCNTLNALAQACRQLTLS